MSESCCRCDQSAPPHCVCRHPQARRFPRPTLSDRERETLLAWLRHDSKKEAAVELFVAESTVSTHIERIRDKYDALGRPAPTKALLLVRAIQDGLIDVDDL